MKIGIIGPSKLESLEDINKNDTRYFSTTQTIYFVKKR